MQPTPYPLLEHEVFSLADLVLFFFLLSPSSPSLSPPWLAQFFQSEGARARLLAHCKSSQAHVSIAAEDTERGAAQPSEEDLKRQAEMKRLLLLSLFLFPFPSDHSP